MQLQLPCSKVDALTSAKGFIFASARRPRFVTGVMQALGIVANLQCPLVYSAITVILTH
jgi:hypothetical protein